MRFLLDTETPYLGLLGPRKRGQALLEELATRHGVHPDAGRRLRLYGPVGLDIGAELPAAIALSLVAEIHAVLNHRNGLPLTYRSDGKSA